VKPIAFETGMRETYRRYLRQRRRKLNFSFEDRLIAAAGVRRAV
jgi:hypothetical protein